MENPDKTVTEETADQKTTTEVKETAGTPATKEVEKTVEHSEK